MKKFEILRELPKSGTGIQSDQMLLKNAVGKIDRLAWCRVATNLQFVKSALSVKRDKAKRDKAKCTKMKFACTLIIESSGVDK